MEMAIDMIFVQSTKWQPKLFATLYQFQADGLLCDVLLQTEDACSLPAHGCVLAAASPYLKDAISTKKVGCVVKLPGIYNEAMRVILSYIYSGEVAFPQTQVQEVLQTAHRLQIHTLMEEMATFQSPAIVKPLEIVPSSNIDEYREQQQECPSQSSSQMELAVNQFSGVKAGSLKCQYCDKQVQQKGGLVIHERHCSSNPNSNSYRAPGMLQKTATLAECEKYVTIAPIADDVSSVPEAADSRAARRRHTYYGCDQCSTVCDTPSELAQHRLQVHEKTAPDYACPLCEVSCSTYDELYHHLKSAHDKDNTAVKKILPVRCANCKERFTSDECLDAHQAFFHDKTVWKYSCKHCNKQYKFLASYQKHVNECTVKTEKIVGKRLVCKLCRATFRFRTGMQNHLEKKHNMMNPNVSSMTLNKSSSETDDKAELMIPELNDSGERIYKCKFCSMKYKYGASYQKHMKDGCKAAAIATRTQEDYIDLRDDGDEDADPVEEEEANGQTAYICIECGEGFNKREKLDHHRLSQHSMRVKNVPCGYCKQMFYNSGNRDQHVYFKHPQAFGGEPPAKKQKISESQDCEENSNSLSGNSSSTLSKTEHQSLTEDKSLRVVKDARNDVTPYLKHLRRMLVPHVKEPSAEPLIVPVTLPPQAGAAQLWRCSRCSKLFMDQAPITKHMKKKCSQVDLKGQPSHLLFQCKHCEYLCQTGATAINHLTTRTQCFIDRCERAAAEGLPSPELDLPVTSGDSQAEAIKSPQSLPTDVKQPAGQKMTGDGWINQEYPCRLCGQVFFSVVHVHAHARNRHPGQEAEASLNYYRSGQRQCQICQLEFNTNKLKYWMHVWIEHGLKTKLKGNYYSCDYCQFRCCYLDEIEKHGTTHFTPEELEKPYKCDECNERFRRKGALDAHMRVHAKEARKAIEQEIKEASKLECVHCGNKYNSKYYLSTHSCTFKNTKAEATSVYTESSNDTLMGKEIDDGTIDYSDNGDQSAADFERDNCSLGDEIINMTTCGESQGNAEQECADDTEGTRNVGGQEVCNDQSKIVTNNKHDSQSNEETQDAEASISSSKDLDIDSIRANLDEETERVFNVLGSVKQ